MINVFVAAAIVMLFARLREVKQRLEKGNKWYICESGCTLDLLFWLIGISSGVLLKILIL